MEFFVSKNAISTSLFEKGIYFLGWTEFLFNQLFLLQVGDDNYGMDGTIEFDVERRIKCASKITPSTIRQIRRISKK
jgi:hypothetical protein